MRRMMLVLVSLFVVSSVMAGPPRRYRNNGYVMVQQQQVTYASQEVTKSCSEALDEVNKTRAERGLSPFIHDPLLSKAAFEAAKQRCVRRLTGHLENDFACVPSGTSASSAGCGAWEPGTGWGTCCTYDNYTYAGAAWAIGTDGVRYMHLFVR